MKKLTARQVAALSPEARERYEKKLKKATVSQSFRQELITRPNRYLMPQALRSVTI